MILFTPLYLCYFNMSILFLEQITGNAPRQLFLKDDIINRAYHLYQYLKQGLNLLLVNFNIMVIYYLIPPFMLYLFCYVRKLPGIYMKNNKRRIQFHNLSMFLKE